MIIVRNPRTQGLFHPYAHAPSIAYWLMQPTEGKPDDDDKTAVAANKQGEEGQQQQVADNKPTNKKPRQSFPLILNDFEILEEDDKYVLTTDLPGVKHADLKVEFHDGALHIAGERKKGSGTQRFTRRLAMNEDGIDVAQLSATLEDGILTVTAPKKMVPDKKKEDGSEADTTKTVPVSKTSPPDSPMEMNLEVDVPGIKVEDLEVVLTKDGTLRITGERKRGQSQPIKMTRVYMLNSRKVDTAKLEAYLFDGVLTIRAPAKEHLVKTVAVNGKLPPPKTIEDQKQEDDKKKEE